MQLVQKLIQSRHFVVRETVLRHDRVLRDSWEAQQAQQTMNEVEECQQHATVLT